MSCKQRGSYASASTRYLMTVLLDPVRRESGTTLAEAPVGIGLVILGMIAAVFFLLDVCQVMIYKQKLAVAANLGARQATALSGGSWGYLFNHNYNNESIETAATSTVKATLARFGIPAANIANTKVTINYDERIVIVTVNCPNLPIIFGGWLLPSTLNLQESGAQMSAPWPPGNFAIITSSSGQSVVLPSYGQVKLPPSHWTRHVSQYTMTINSATYGYKTMGPISDPSWFQLSPVYPN